MASYRLHAVNLLKKFFSGDISRIAQERNRLFRNGKVEEQNHTRFNSLIHGVVRRFRSLDSVIATFSDYPLQDLEPDVQEFLRTSLFEILFFDAVPDPVAVNEAVDQARRHTGSGPANFINAVLREAMRNLTEEYWEFPDDLNRKGIEHLFPVRDGRCREFQSRIFPSPGENNDSFHKYLSRAFNLPEWVCRTWREAYGREKALRTARYQAEEPPMFLRRVTKNISAEDFEASLEEAGLNWIRIKEGPYYRLENNRPPESIPGFEEGYFFVQDPGTGLFAERFSPDQSGVHLDLCSAPGGKLLQSLDQNEEDTLYVGLDRDRRRLKNVGENLKRLGFPAHLSAGDGTQPPFREETADVVVLDVPCSNTAVLGRRVEARYHLESGLNEDLTRIQKNLLRSGLRLLRPGGTLLYLSCSLLPEENEQLIGSTLSGKQNVRLKEPELSFPDGTVPSGGFGAEISRTETETSD